MDLLQGGGESESTAAISVLQALGNAYLANAQFDKAISSFEQSISIMDKSGSLPSDLAFSCCLLASAYEEQGNMDEAIQQYERANSYLLAEKAQEVQSSESKDAQVAVNYQLGSLYSRLGSFAAAEKTLQEAYDLVMELGGDNDPRTSEILYLLEVASNFPDQSADEGGGLSQPEETAEKVESKPAVAMTGKSLGHQWHFDLCLPNPPSHSHDVLFE